MSDATDGPDGVAVGAVVQHRLDLRRTGVVRRILRIGGREFAEVTWFPAQDKTQVPVDDLVPEAEAELTPTAQLASGRTGGPEHLQAVITIERLRRDDPLRGNLFALNASRTQFYAYQFKPLLKLLDSPNHRILIADEVGLGKTIEAGLILTELQARTDLQRTIIVAPSRLRSKWLAEMQRRFGLEFRAWKLRELVAHQDERADGWLHERLSAFVSLESLRSAADIEALAAFEPDLLIVDEAHHLRNRGTKQARSVSAMAETAQALVLLTATPIHLRNDDLHSLLHLVDADQFPDAETTIERMQANEGLVAAERALAIRPPDLDAARLGLARAATTRWGSLVSAVLPLLERLNALDPETQASRFEIRELRDRVADLNLLGKAISRSRKRDVHENAPKREARVVRVPMTADERAVYRAVTEFVMSEAQRRGRGSADAFTLGTPQRRLASSIPAMVDFYRQKLAGDSDDDLFEEEGDGAGAAAERLLDALSAWTADSVDSKYAQLVTLLREIGRESPPPKVVLFATYKHTLDYLRRRLQADGLEVLLMTGSTPVVERSELLRKFEESPTVRVLLTSRVGCEGLDLQFARVLVNYDLPWNPMEVEQRIGRLDRIGQQAQVITILSLCLGDTIEDRILAMLYERIGLFERSLGDLEVILGDTVQEIGRDLVDPNLSEAERERRIAHLADVALQKHADNERLEKESARLVAADAVIDDEIAAIRSGRRFVTANQMERMVADFLRTACPKSKIRRQEGKAYSLIVAEDLRAFLREAGLAAPLVRWFATNPGGIDVTFDQTTAYQRPLIEFLNVVHPFIQAVVAWTLRHPSPRAALLSLRWDAVPPGLYFFAVYSVRVLAARKHRALEVVVVNAEDDRILPEDLSTELLPLLLERAEELPGDAVEIAERHLTVLSELAASVLLHRLDQQRAALQIGNDTYLATRRGSVSAFFDRRIAKEEELLSRGQQQSRDPRYLRLREGSIRRMTSERDEKLLELEQLAQVSQEHAEVAVGIVEVLGGV